MYYMYNYNTFNEARNVAIKSSKTFRNSYYVISYIHEEDKFYGVIPFYDVGSICLSDRIEDRILHREIMNKVF